MIVGVPGAGINGLFYLAVAGFMPVAELWRTVRGRSSLSRWRAVLGQVAMAAGVLGILYGEYWGIFKAADFLTSHSAGGAKSAQASTAVLAAENLAPKFALLPLVLLVAVVLAVQLLRVVLPAVSAVAGWWRNAGGKGREGSGKTLPLALLLGASAALACGGIGCATATTGSLPAATVVHQPPGFEFASCIDSIREEYESVGDFYQLYFDGMAAGKADRPYGLALANQTLGLLRNDPAYIERARRLYEADRATAGDARQREAGMLGQQCAAAVLSGEYTAGRQPAAPEPMTFEKAPAPTKDFHKIILGTSSIAVPRGALVKTQVDRVVRDWLLGRNVKVAPWDYDKDRLVPWHEGGKIGELVTLADVKVVPVWGTRASKIGEKWYAPDATGAPRFEISEDKVINYPSTIVVDDATAIINDTHGISAIAWDCLDASLVVGCGDHRGKMEAAYYLARRGVNVYVPTDRFLGMLIGAQTQGMIIGSAPVKKSPQGAVIGDQPVTIDIDEPIVVSTAKAKYPLQYYDTPSRYFTALAEYCGKPLKLVPVEVKEYGKATNVIDEARKLNAKVIGIRVKSKLEHDAMAQWLKEDATRRAVLFHTAVYPDGYQLFFEFPKQTTFGDIHPQFE